jgi:hypothetical protein
MKIISLKSLKQLKEQNDSQKYLSNHMEDTITTDILETEVSFSYRVFDKTGKKTLSFWQYIKPATINK